MRFSGPAPVNVRIKRNVETGNATEDLLQLQQDLELSDEEGLGTVSYYRKQLFPHEGLILLLFTYCSFRMT